KADQWQTSILRPTAAPVRPPSDGGNELAENADFTASAAVMSNQRPIRSPPMRWAGSGVPEELLDGINVPASPLVACRGTLTPPSPTLAGSRPFPRARPADRSPAAARSAAVRRSSA